MKEKYENMNKKIKCAVIGANGYIGRHIEAYLKSAGVIPMCYDMQESEEKNYRKVDLTSVESVKVIDLNVDYIFLFAGITGTYVGFDKYDKYVDINEIGLLNILDAIRKSDFRPKVVFPSTRLVYKGLDRPLKEEDEKETRTIYAVNKLACERILQAYKYSFDIPYVIFRICIPYGNLISKDYSFGTVGFFIKQSRNGEDISLYGDGTIKRNFTHIKDLCFKIVQGAFCEESNGEVYNVGGETLSLKEAAKIISEKYANNVLNIPWPEKDLRIESNHTYFDDTKIKRLLDIQSYRLLNDFLKDL